MADGFELRHHLPDSGLMGRIDDRTSGLDDVQHFAEKDAITDLHGQTADPLAQVGKDGIEQGHVLELQLAKAGDRRKGRGSVDLVVVVDLLQVANGGLLVIGFHSRFEGRVDPRGSPPCARAGRA